MSEYTTNDILKLIDQHRFHNPLQSRTCHLCKVEAFRQSNTPTVRWSRAVRTAFQPPMPVAVMLVGLLIQTIAIALLLS
jgi:hypothetical protein